MSDRAAALAPRIADLGCGQGRPAATAEPLTSGSVAAAPGAGPRAVRCRVRQVEGPPEAVVGRGVVASLPLLLDVLEDARP